MNFLSPTFLKIYAALALVLTLAAGVYYIHHDGYVEGWTDRDVETQAEIAKKNQESKDKEDAAKTKIAAIDKELQKAKDEIQNKRVALRDLANAGRLRLPSASCLPTPENPGSTGLTVRTDEAELERQTINALIDIAADGDTAIQNYNQCIKLYNQVKDTINGNSTTPEPAENK
jgi:hypothetical protein